MDLIAECRERSLDLLRRAAGPLGFVASPADDHYAAVWVRDAAVACLGARRSGDPALVAAATRTLDTMLAQPGPAGQIPNTVWPDGRADGGEAGAVDPSAWAVIVAADLAAAGADGGVVAARERELRAAGTWLAGLDPAGAGLVSSAPATDWMDSSLQRSGWVLHVNVLTAWAAACLAELGLGEAAGRSGRVNDVFWPRPGGAEFRHHASAAAYEAAAASERRHYLSHIAHAAFVDRCDVLANLLAIVAGVSGSERADAILGFLDDRGVADPFPSKTWPEPVTEDDDPWRMWARPSEQHIPERWRNPPHRYHNAAVWPYVGGFHAAAVALTGRPGDAAALLERVAAANRVGEWGFHEWLDGRTGGPGGAAAQTWNAGAFLFADGVLRGEQPVGRP